MNYFVIADDIKTDFPATITGFYYTPSFTMRMNETPRLREKKNRAKTISVSTKRFVTAYSINKFHLELGKKMAILYF